MEIVKKVSQGFVEKVRGVAISQKIGFQKFYFFVEELPVGADVIGSKKEG